MTRRFAHLAVVLLLAAGTLPAAAQTLTNWFADRALLTAATGQVNGNNSQASNEPEEPRHGGKPGGSSVWISWQAPADGVATFNTAGSSFDTLLSAYYFPQPTDTTLDRLKESARNDDAPTQEPTSLIQFGAHAGQLYHIAVDGYLGATGSIRLRWDFVAITSPPPVVVSTPADRSALQGETVTLTVDMQASPDLDLQWRFNDESFDAKGPTLVLPNLQATNVGRYTLRIRIGDVRFETTPTEIQINSEGQTNVLARDKLFDALESPLTQDSAGAQPAGSPPRLQRQDTGVSRGYNGTQIFNTLFATVDPAEPQHCGLAPTATYWFAYQPPTNGTLVIDTVGSGFDAFLAAYTHDLPLTNYSSLIPITCDSHSVGGTNARVEFAAPANRQFFIVMGGINGAKGIGQLNYHLDTNRPPVLPELPASAPVHRAAVGTPFTLTAQAAGSPPLTFAWFKNQVAIPDQFSSSLTFAALQLDDDGLYQVRVANYLGQATSSPIQLRVLVPPQLTLLRRDGLDLLSFLTRTGQVYALEYSDSISPTAWLPLGEARDGTGEPVTLTNAPTDAAVRFYRAAVR